MAVTERSVGEVHAHRTTAIESTQSITKFLVDLLGAALTARLADVDVSTVNRWKAGNGGPPQHASEARLRAAHQVGRLLLAGDSDHTVRAWFIGMNPQLDDEAPLDAIAADQFKAVLSAARSFLAGG